MATKQKNHEDETPQKKVSKNNKQSSVEEEAEHGNMGAQEAVEIKEKVKSGGGRDLTTAQAGKLGGETVSAERGEEFYEDIGTRGQQSLKRKLGEKEPEFREKTGRAGGLSRTGSYNEYADELEEINAQIRDQCREEGKIPESYDSYIAETVKPAMVKVRGSYRTWIQEMYRLLTEEGECSPTEARNIVELDGQELGISYLYIVRVLPAEAKNQVKAEAARQKGKAITRAKEEARKVDEEEPEEEETPPEEEEEQPPSAGEVPQPQRIKSKTTMPRSILVNLDEQIIDADGNESTWIDAHDMAVNRANRMGTGKIRFVFDEDQLAEGVFSILSIEPVQAKAKAKRKEAAAA